MAVTGSGRGGGGVALDPVGPTVHNSLHAADVLQTFNGLLCSSPALLYLRPIEKVTRDELGGRRRYGRMLTLENGRACDP